MKRNSMVETLDQDKLIEHKQCIAYHEAGHAAGIHLNNKARKLPPVFFTIIFKEIRDITAIEVGAYQATHNDCIARVEGGRLIELLPSSLEELVEELTDDHDTTVELLKDYMLAFEADIINLLIGPLAEAKYVANTDDELFNHQLVNLKALKHYGGNSDLALAHEYLHSFSTNKQQRDTKLAELFAIAFNFVNNDENWAAITCLADYIFNSHKNTIDCEEAISILNQSVEHFKNRRLKIRHHYE